jgi:hypothetical protein
MKENNKAKSGHSQQILETGQSYKKTEDIVGILHVNKERPLQT